ncbi:hypothetical protein ACFQ1S_09575, partial [Kibdelosporangium lantanae]
QGRTDLLAYALAEPALALAVNHGRDLMVPYVSSMRLAERLTFLRRFLPPTCVMRRAIARPAGVE